MNIRSRRALRQHAADSLAHASGNPVKIVLIFGGIICSLALAATVISYLLSLQISETGGLSSMGLRSILATVKYVLPIVQMIAALCLELGYSKATLDISRGRPARTETLLEGFRRFGPLIRALILQVLIITVICIATMYLSSYIFMFLPVSGPFYEAVEPLLSSMTALDTELALDDATLYALSETMIPMLWIFAAVFSIAAVPMLYSFRMVNYCLVDGDRIGAIAAMGMSRNMMRRNRFALFRLDLGFWWYYLLQALVTVVAYGDVLLAMLDIALPWSDTVSYFLFYGLSLALQMGVYWLFMNRVQVTYAAAYDALKPQSQPPAAM